MSPARTRRGTAAAGTRPSATAGEARLRRGGAGRCPWPAPPAPPGWPRRGFAAGGRAEPRGGGAGAPVPVGFVFADPFRPPGRAYLAVRRDEPVQYRGRPRVRRQLGTLVAVAVGEEDQPAPQAAQHHQAGRRNAVTGRGGDGHGFWHRLACRAGLIQPPGQLAQRVGFKVSEIHPPSVAPRGHGRQAGRPGPQLTRPRHHGGRPGPVRESEFPRIRPLSLYRL